MNFFRTWGHDVPNMFEIARKFIKKSAILQESWPQRFRGRFLVTVVGQIIVWSNDANLKNLVRLHTSAVPQSFHYLPFCV